MSGSAERANAKLLEDAGAEKIGTAGRGEKLTERMAVRQ